MARLLMLTSVISDRDRFKKQCLSLHEPAAATSTSAKDLTTHSHTIVSRLYVPTLGFHPKPRQIRHSLAFP
jgi:hypothetical protein